MRNRENLLAHQLAGEAARADIECYCRLIMPSNDRQKSHWYDASHPAPHREGEHAQYVPIAIEYLALAGKIERNAIHSEWIRILIGKNRNARPA
jgi:hypothetical protein